MAADEAIPFHECVRSINLERLRAWILTLRRRLRALDRCASRYRTSQQADTVKTVSSLLSLDNLCMPYLDLDNGIIWVYDSAQAHLASVPNGFTFMAH